MYYVMDHTVIFAIDRIIRASDIQKLDQNIDLIYALFDATTGHTHGGGADSGGPVVVPDNSITGAKLTNYALGDDLLISSDIERSRGASGTPVKVKEAKMHRAGSLRIKIDAKTSSGVAATSVEIWKNGTLIAGTLQNTGSTTYVTLSWDIAGWAADDLVQVYYYNNAATHWVQNFRIYTAPLAEEVTLN